MSTFDFGFDDFEDSPREGYLKELVAAYEDDPSSYFDSGDLEEIASFYFEDGRMEKALEVIDHLIELHPYQSDAWMRRGILLNNLGRPEDALEAYDRALDLNPADAETLINRGITLDSLGRKAEAL